MRTIYRLVLTLCVGLAVLGCGHPSGEYEGPKVDAFHGKLTQNGNPVKFGENEEASLSVFHHESARQFGVPLKPDGSFEIGWMPIGKYSMMLERTSKHKRGNTKSRFGVPSELVIEAGKKDYVIELGKSYKP